MTRVIGKGRYAGEVYPTSPGAAGGSSASNEPMVGEQLVATDATLVLGANATGGTVHASKATVFVPQAAAAGESMVIVLTTAGGLTLDFNFGGFTVDNTTPTGAVDIPVDPSVDIPAGAVILAVIDYTAGGGPTPLNSTVIRVEFA